MKALAKAALRSIGFELRNVSMDGADYTDFEREVAALVKPYTMTPPTRIVAVMDAVRYVSRANVAGAIVECGVWRGGCMMAAAMALKSLGDVRDLFLFDTYAGMSEATDLDVDLFGQHASTGCGEAWQPASVDDVRAAMALTGYPMDRVHCIAGKVEDTLPGCAPENIAVLRLDTDWYESTAHELEQLFPRLASRGVLILDDYGHWQGARRAVDEYIAQLERPLLLHRTDYASRVALKP